MTVRQIFEYPEESSSIFEAKQSETASPRERNSISTDEMLSDSTEPSSFAVVENFFRDNTLCSKENVKLMVDIINSNHEVSLRNLNWFGTKHLKTMKSRYRILKNGRKELFDPKITYEKHQYPYGKKGFDPFRRGTTFEWRYDKSDSTKSVTTTVCQLRFFKWIFEYNLMSYVLENLESLKELQKTYEKSKKSAAKKKAKSAIPKIPPAERVTKIELF